MRPPVVVFAPVFGFASADLIRWGIVALRVLYEPSTSMSMTDLKAFVETPIKGARKFPAAPALIYLLV
jgi:hypothetical protein